MVGYFILWLIIIIENLILRSQKLKNLIIAFTILTFLSIRFGVGYDFFEYYNLAKQYELSSLLLNVNLADYVGEGYLYFKMEFLNRVLYKISWYLKTPQMIIILYALIQIFFLFVGFNIKKMNSFYSWLYFMALPFFMLGFMSTMRQGVAVSMLFYNYINIKNRKFLRFIIIVVIASMFHITAISFVPAYFIANNRHGIKKILILGIGGLCSLILFSYLNKIFDLFYSIYSKNIMISGGKLTTVVVLFSLFTILKLHKYLVQNDNEDNEKIIKIVIVGAIIIFGIYIIGDIATRIGIYYYVYILFLIDDLFDTFNKNTILRITYIIICLLMIEYSSLSGDRGRYQTIFNSQEIYEDGSKS